MEMGTLQPDRLRDGNDNIKKMVLEGKTTTLRVHHTLLYISLPFLHDYDVTFQGGRKQATTKFYFSF